PYTNMLRTTTEGMSAAIAGCDAITIHPFDHIFEQPEDFGRRIARNAQIIFSEEARLNQVFDPGAGSYYIEMLTDRIAGQSWKLFQEIEKQGGMMAAVANRSITTMIASAAEERERAVAERKRIFVGTNQYPNAGERRGDAIDFDGRFQVTSLLESEKDLKFTVDRDRIVESLAEALGKGALFGDIVPELFDPGKQLFRPIQPGRATEKLEELRLATERRGDPPSVFLVPMGDRKRRRARSTFAGNFLGCAGYEITDHIGFDSVDDAVDGIRKAAPDIVVLCSSDPEYKELVKPFCSRMASLDNEPLVLLAGYPDDEEEADRYRKAGIDMFIHSRSNLPDRLKELHRKMGILNR
ncbi:MAG: methylmalonyl-CoA mutase family protein, partial [Balneolaceae bacterium]|nr:methylmalonyl-CoA mutase family protein [Balneolaceae bacterium]